MYETSTSDKRTIHPVSTVDIHENVFDILEIVERRLRDSLNNIKECLE